MTGFDLSNSYENQKANDPWKYKEQMYGPLLTGPSKLNSDFLQWRKTQEYCMPSSIIKNEQECQIMTFD